jgi:hypothetical protein
MPRNHDHRVLAQELEAFMRANELDLLRPRPFEPERSCQVLTLRVLGDGGRVKDVVARLTALPGPATAAGEPEPLPWPLPELPLSEEHWIVGLELPPFEVENEAARTDMLLVDAATDRLQALRVCRDAGRSARRGAAGIRQPAAAGRRGPAPQRSVLRMRGRAGVALDRRAASPSGGHSKNSCVHGCMREQMTPAPREREAGTWQSRTHWSARTSPERRTRRRSQASIVAPAGADQNFGDTATFAALRERNSMLGETAFRSWFCAHYRGKAAGASPSACSRATADRSAGCRPGSGAGRPVPRGAPPLIAFAACCRLRDRRARQSARRTCRQAWRCRADRRSRRRALHRAARPPIAAGHVEAAVQRERSFVHQRRSRSAQMLGSLWSWLFAQAAAAVPPRLTNTDGEPLRMQTATFRVADWNAVLDAFGRHADVEEEETDRWGWLRRAPGGEAGLGATLLASMERVADELLVHVNSEARLQRAREWLEAIDGVAFVGLRDAVVDDGTSAAALRQLRAGPELPPTALAELQQHFDRQCMRGSTIVPALGHRTHGRSSRARKGASRCCG